LCAECWTHHVLQDIEPAPVELAQMGHWAERGVDEPDSFVALHALAVDSRCGENACPVGAIFSSKDGSLPRQARDRHEET
jgi:hypothetical protein